MQTFLPYEDFDLTAECLDMRRLGKQRVECLQILKVLHGETKGWQNHPAVKMWRGYEACLAIYGMAICQEWIERGYKDTCMKKIEDYYVYSGQLKVKYPPFLGNIDFHNSHKSNLLRKMPEHYGLLGWNIPDDLPYVWGMEDLTMVKV